MLTNLLPERLVYFLYNRIALPWDRVYSQYQKKRYSAREARRFAQFPNLLSAYEKSIFSQNGEDGILEEIFRRIGTTNRYFVEIGVGLGNGSRAQEMECNTRHLAHNGWKGLWLDGNPEVGEWLKGHPELCQVVSQSCFITQNNLTQILKEAGAPIEFDLFSIDIDGNDYWVWKDLLEFRPRVVVVEYNGSYPPPREWIMPYEATHRWDHTRHYGASLCSFEKLARQKGYRLVGCDRQGVNAFFVREDLVGDRFLSGDAEFFYVAPKFHPDFFGWPKRQPLVR